MTPASVERLALLAGVSPTQAHALAVQHQRTDITPWLTEILRADVRRMREKFEAERVCPACGSKNTTTVVADNAYIDSWGVHTPSNYVRECRTCQRVWSPQRTR